MTALLGATLFKIGEMDEAEEFLRRATELAPSFAKPHEDLGYLLVEQGRPDVAIDLETCRWRRRPMLRHIERLVNYLASCPRRQPLQFSLIIDTSPKVSRQLSITACNVR